MSQEKADDQSNISDHEVYETSISSSKTSDIKADNPAPDSDVISGENVNVSDSSQRRVCSQRSSTEETTEIPGVTEEMKSANSKCPPHNLSKDVQRLSLMPSSSKSADTSNVIFDEDTETDKQTVVFSPSKRRNVSSVDDSRLTSESGDTCNASFDEATETDQQRFVFSPKQRRISSVDDPRYASKSSNVSVDEATDDRQMEISISSPKRQYASQIEDSNNKSKSEDTCDLPENQAIEDSQTAAIPDPVPGSIDFDVEQEEVFKKTLREKNPMLNQLLGKKPMIVFKKPEAPPPRSKTISSRGKSQSKSPVLSPRSQLHTSRSQTPAQHLISKSKSSTSSHQKLKSNSSTSPHREESQSRSPSSQEMTDPIPEVEPENIIIAASKNTKVIATSADNARIPNPSPSEEENANRRPTQYSMNLSVTNITRPTVIIYKQTDLSDSNRESVDQTPSQDFTVPLDLSRSTLTRNQADRTCPSSESTDTVNQSTLIHARSDRDRTRADDTVSSTPIWDQADRANLSSEPTSTFRRMVSIRRRPNLYRLSSGPTHNVIHERADRIRSRSDSSNTHSQSTLIRERADRTRSRSDSSNTHIQSTLIQERADRTLSRSDSTVTAQQFVAPITENCSEDTSSMDTSPTHKDNSSSKE